MWMIKLYWLKDYIRELNDYKQWGKLQFVDDHIILGKD